MASKLAVAGIIEGNFTDEGLAAMSDCEDMTTALARELTAGIKDEVEDLGAVFKKMAILKPVTDIVQEAANVIDISDIAVNNVVDVPTQSADEYDIFTPSSGLLSLLSYNKAKRAVKKKVMVVCDNQLSLFDLEAVG
jgi:hypothetical protein